jgi:hypothetical protein
MKDIIIEIRTQWIGEWKHKTKEKKPEDRFEVSQNIGHRGKL